MRKFQKSAERTWERSGGARRSPNHTRTLWIWAERVLLALGLALLAVYGAARIDSVVTSREALKKFADMDSTSTLPSRNRGESSGASERMAGPKPDFSLWDSQRVLAYNASLAWRQGAPLAVLRISKIRLEVPLLEGTDDLTLNHAVGRIAGTARPGEHGNIGIAGHRDGFFRGLKDVRVGDAIELETFAAADTYTVDRIQIVQPEDIGVLQPRSVPSLTLVTCYPFYFIGNAPQRYIVTASLTREIQGGTENPQYIGSPLPTSNANRRSYEQAE